MCHIELNECKGLDKEQLERHANRSRSGTTIIRMRETSRIMEERRANSLIGVLCHSRRTQLSRVVQVQVLLRLQVCFTTHLSSQSNNR